jgi:hypothetical protein
MHPLMVPALAELRLSEARDRAAALRLARSVRRSRGAGTIREPESEPASRRKRQPLRPLLAFASGGHSEPAAEELECRCSS